MPWLAALLADDPVPDRAELQRRMRVVHLLLVGKFDEAARELARPVSDAGAFFQRTLAARLAIRAGSQLPPPRDHERWSSSYDEILRRGTLPDDHGLIIEAFPKSCPLDEALKLALAGDGGPLARVFRTCSVLWPRSFPWLPAILPRVTAHRAELAAVARFYRNTLPLGYRLSPFETVDDFALYRNTSRLAGDEADRWQAIIARHAAMLSDRRRVIAFAIGSEI